MSNRTVHVLIFGEPCLSDQTRSGVGRGSCAGFRTRESLTEKTDLQGILTLWQASLDLHRDCWTEAVIFCLDDGLRRCMWGNGPLEAALRLALAMDPFPDFPLSSLVGEDAFPMPRKAAS